MNSSVALHGVLPDGSPAAKERFADAIQAEQSFCSSALLRVEVTRTLRREGLDLRPAAAFFDRVRFLLIQDATLRLAAGIEPHIKSLDAIHLAAAILSGLNPTVVTHDANMKSVAGQLGLATFDPMEP
nr:PIN domain-containing protein [Sediminivirga luteola]